MRRTMTVLPLGLVCMWLSACGADSADLSGQAELVDERDGFDNANGNGGGVTCNCQPGFVCEFGQCVPETPPGAAADSVRDPRASARYVFDLQLEAQRLVRIDSESLQARSFSAGLAPMDLAIEPDRELSVLLDAFDLIEVLDHRVDPPVSATYPTARSLSHLVLSPTGAHAIAYYDWDDPRAGQRQSEPGNINQLTVLDLTDGATEFSDRDARAVNVAVGLLPRDVRFAVDGSRAVVIGRDAVTRIDLRGTPAPETVFALSAEPAEVLVTDDASALVARYGSEELEVLRLADGARACVTHPFAVSDLERVSESGVFVVYGESESFQAAVLDPLSLDFAATECASTSPTLDLGPYRRLQMNRDGTRGVAFTPEIDRERLLVLDGLTRTEVRLEKAVSSVAFGPDGRFVFIAHLKRDGVPAWDPTVESPDDSVDKSFGVTWLDLDTLDNRLAISEWPFGRFTFVPAVPGRAAATYVAVLDPFEPELLRVSHATGFDDRWLRLAATPLSLGFLPGTDRAYVTQDHPWGRVTFIDPTGQELRHVTGFALLQ